MSYRFISLFFHYTPCTLHLSFAASFHSAPAASTHTDILHDIAAAVVVAGLEAFMVVF
jgi:hypothetical protein